MTPWTAAHWAPPSMGFSRQEYWSGVPLPSLILMAEASILILFYFLFFKYFKYLNIVGEINIYSDNITREKICMPRANTEE